MLDNMIYVLIGLVALVLVGQGVVVWGLSARRSPPGGAPDTPWLDELVQLRARVAELEIQVAGLPSLWEDERRRVELHADRARKAEARARALREESDEDEDAAEDVLQLDALGGDEGGLPPVRAGLGGGGEGADPLTAARNQLAVGALLSPGRTRR